MRNRRYVVFTLALLLIVGCSQNAAENQGQGEYRVAVRTAPVEQADFPVQLSLTGTIKGERQTVIPAKTTSSVTDVKVRVGQRVTEGQLLLQLDRGGVQSQYHQTEALFRNAEKQLNKMRSLYDAGAISERELDMTTTDYEVARANYNAAREAVDVESPIDGVVTDLYVRTGDEVSPGSNLLEVADVSALRLVLEVPTTQISQLKVGQPVTVRAPDDSAVVMTGKVATIADAADKATRSFEVECHFANPPAGFSPGTFAVATINVRTVRNALLINADALLYRAGETYTYAVRGDTAVLVPVNVIAFGDSRAAVDADLTAGQKVVTTGQKNLTPGALVREAGS